MAGSGGSSNKTTRSLYKAYKNMYTIEDDSTRERSSE